MAWKLPILYLFRLLIITFGRMVQYESHFRLRAPLNGLIRFFLLAYEDGALPQNPKEQLIQRTKWIAIIIDAVISIVQCGYAITQT